MKGFETFQWPESLWKLGLFRILHADPLQPAVLWAIYCSNLKATDWKYEMSLVKWRILTICTTRGKKRSTSFRFPFCLTFAGCREARHVNADWKFSSGQKKQVWMHILPQEFPHFTQYWMFIIWRVKEQKRENWPPCLASLQVPLCDVGIIRATVQ